MMGWIGGMDGIAFCILFLLVLLSSSSSCYYCLLEGEKITSLERTRELLPSFLIRAGNEQG